MQLAMHIATNSYRGLNKLCISFVGKDFFGFLYNKLDLFLSNRFEGLKIVNNDIKLIIILAH